MVDTSESWVQEPPTLELPTPDLTPDPTLDPTPDPTLDPTPEQTPESTPEQTLKQTPEPIQEPTLIGPSGPLTQKTTHQEAVSEIHGDISDINIVEGRRIFYVDDIMTICRRENIPKLRLFKEELMKKYKIA